MAETPRTSLPPYVWVLIAVLALLPLASSCAHFAAKPLEVLRYKGTDTSHDNLLVFVRGLGGSHRTFAEEGMIDATWHRKIDFDMIAPDSHFAYYAERTLIPRLHADVLLPAKQQGYKRIWLIGPSMGGLGSLLYTRDHPEMVDGICLLSPFLGDDDILESIEAQGGLRHWRPGSYDADQDWQTMLWHWLQAQVNGGEKAIPIYLLFGEDDMYVQAHRLLAAALPVERVFSLPGGHDYGTFKALWLLFLDNGPLHQY